MITPAQQFNAAPARPIDCLEKEKALKALIHAEGNGSEASSDLAVITGSLRENEGLNGATGEFIRLLQFEGRDNTNAVQDHYRTIDGCLKPWEARKDAVTQFIALGNAEGNTSEAKSDFQLVNRFVSQGESRDYVTGQFVRLIEFEGRANTNAVQDHFVEIASSMKPWETRKDVVTQFIALGNAEGNSSEAKSDFQLIHRFVSKEVTREALTGQFTRLLEFEGRANTSAVQSHFTLIGTTLREGETWQGAVSQFIKLGNAEGNTSEAKSDYELINSYVKPDESREMLTDQFIRILNEVGRANTSTAQRMFREIHA